MKKLVNAENLGVCLKAFSIVRAAEFSNIFKSLREDLLDSEDKLLVERIDHVQLFEIIPKVLILLHAAGIEFQLQVKAGALEKGQPGVFIFEFFPCSNFSLTSSLQYLGPIISLIVSEDPNVNFNFQISEYCLDQSDPDQDFIVNRRLHQESHKPSDLSVSFVLDMFLRGLPNFVFRKLPIESCVTKDSNPSPLTEAELDAICDNLVRFPFKGLMEQGTHTDPLAHSKDTDVNRVPVSKVVSPDQRLN